MRADFGKIDLSFWDVLAAALTKWNFLPFEPGLVGGHCSGVDPYISATWRKSSGFICRSCSPGARPTMRWGRGSPTSCTRDAEAERARAGDGADVQGECPQPAQQSHRQHRPPPRRAGYDVAPTDPITDLAEVGRDYGRVPIALNGEAYDLVVAAGAHDEYRSHGDERLATLVAPGGILAGLKTMWREGNLPASIGRWAL